jgi:hypothetical protein
MGNKKTRYQNLFPKFLFYPADANVFSVGTQGTNSVLGCSSASGGTGILPTK